MSPTALATTAPDDLDDLAADLSAISLSANGYAVITADPLCDEELSLSPGRKDRLVYAGSSQASTAQSGEHTDCAA
jgi:hypothetical protein